MTGQDNGSQGLNPRVADEVEYIRRRFAAKKPAVDVGLVPDGRGGVGYLYVKGELLVLERDLAAVTESLRRRGITVEEQHILRGLLLLRISDKEKKTVPEVPDVLEALDSDLGEGAATPNHILTVSEEVSPCAATDPIPVYDGIEPYPSVCQSNSGAGVRIFIADTGLLPAAKTHSWLATGVDGGEDPESPELNGGRLQPYTGHGTFVAGVLRCMAPAAEIYVGAVFPTAGSAPESDFALSMQQALTGGWDIFHLSIASPTRKNLPLLSFGEWMNLLRRRKGTACVAPAGNSGSSRPHWPGAAPHVACVGALAADWRSRASFSNFGGWVDVYAPGRDLINAYATGDFTCEMVPYAPEVRKFFGMARWNGTSFSSPILTGLIAARMWCSGENGSEAAAALLAQARSQTIPGVGAIVLPCCDERGTQCRCGPQCRCAPQCRCGPQRTACTA